MIGLAACSGSSTSDETANSDNETAATGSKERDLTVELQKMKFAHGSTDCNNAAGRNNG